MNCHPTPTAVGGPFERFSLGKDPLSTPGSLLKGQKLPDPLPSGIFKTPTPLYSPLDAIREKVNEAGRQAHLQQRLKAVLKTNLVPAPQTSLGEPIKKKTFSNGARTRLLHRMKTEYRRSSVPVTPLVAARQPHRMEEMRAQLSRTTLFTTSMEIRQPYGMEVLRVHHNPLFPAHRETELKQAAIHSLTLPPDSGEGSWTTPLPPRLDRQPSNATSLISIKDILKSQGPH